MSPTRPPAPRAPAPPIRQPPTPPPPTLSVRPAANAATILFPAPGSAIPSLSNIIHPVPDTHGIWFGDIGGSISLYTPTIGMRKMAEVAAGEVTAAGGCH